MNPQNEFARKILAHQFQIGFERRMLERMSDACHQSLRTDRLYHKVIGPKPHGLDRHFYGSLRCRDNHADGARARDEALKRFEPPHIRQVEVQYDNPGSVLLNFDYAFGAARGRRHAKASALEKGAVDVGDRRNIFDNQYPYLWPFASSIGRAAD